MSSTSSPSSQLVGALSEWMQELAPFGVLTTDLDLRVQGWNRWLTIHSSLPATQVIGRPLAEVVPEIMSRKLDHYFRRALAGEVSLLSSGLHGYLIPLPMTMVRDEQQPNMLQTARIAPLISNGKVLGTITVIEDVSQRDHHAGILRRQHGRERLLSWALAHLLQSEDPLKDLEAIFPKIAHDLGLQIHFHYLLSPDKKTLHLHSAAGISEEQKILYASFGVGEHTCGRCVSQGQVIYLPHIQTQAPSYASAIQQAGLRCYAGFPLKIRDEVLGVLSFGSLSRETITPEEIELLTTIAQYVAIALDRSSREQILTATQKSLREHADTL
ncbi:MAG TPA: GAF domain-containing protein, partial [Opitutaceae bacterium]|nr:GAF domain-containing protein [Opitutaceae bacterium]